MLRRLSKRNQKESWIKLSGKGNDGAVVLLQGEPAADVRGVDRGPGERGEMDGTEPGRPFAEDDAQDLGRD